MASRFLTIICLGLVASSVSPHPVLAQLDVTIDASGVGDAPVAAEQDPAEPPQTPDDAPNPSDATALSVEQQTQFRQALTASGVAPATDIAVNELAVGEALPSGVAAQPIPPEIAAMLPEFAGMGFLLLPDARIVIVDPATNTVVRIIR